MACCWWPQGPRSAVVPKLGVLVTRKPCTGSPDAGVHIFPLHMGCRIFGSSSHFRGKEISVRDSLRHVEVLPRALVSAQRCSSNKCVRDRSSGNGPLQRAVKAREPREKREPRGKRKPREEGQPREEREPTPGCLSQLDVSGNWALGPPPEEKSTDGALIKSTGWRPCQATPGDGTSGTQFQKLR